MYAAIISEKYSRPLKEALKDKNMVSFKTGTFNEHEALEIFKEIARVAVTTLILDINISNPNILVKCIKSFRILRRNARIIILSPNKTVGDTLISKLVNTGIYDIITPELEENGYENILIESVTNIIESEPYTYSDVAKFDIEYNSIGEAKGEKTKEKVIENTVTIIQDRILGNIVIAAAGICHGVGLTHTCMLMAYYLSNKKGDYKVAVLEHNDSKHFSRLKNKYPEALFENSFVYKDIHFYYKTSLTDLTKLNYYDYIIVDLGILKEIEEDENNVNIINNKYYDEMLRADLSILLCNAKPYHLKDILYCLSKGDLEDQNFTNSENWKLIFNLSDNEYYESMLGTFIEWNPLKIPYAPKIFEYNEEIEALFNNLFKEILPQENTIKNKKRSFFDMFKS